MMFHAAGPTGDLIMPAERHNENGGVIFGISIRIRRPAVSLGDAESSSPINTAAKWP